jgi:hypothetical protein
MIINKETGGRQMNKSTTLILSLILVAMVMMSGSVLCAQPEDDAGAESMPEARSYLFNEFFLPYAKREKPLLWEDMWDALEAAGYEVIEDEGTYSAHVPGDRGGAYLGGMLAAGQHCQGV